MTEMEHLKNTIYTLVLFFICTCLSKATEEENFLSNIRNNIPSCYKISKVEIGHIPPQHTSLTIHFPGTRPQDEVISNPPKVSEWEFLYPFLIKNSQCYLETLRDDEPIDAPSLSCFTRYSSGSRAVDNIFDYFTKGNCEAGTYKMKIDFEDDGEGEHPPLKLKVTFTKLS
jgi:hypothetical protein